MTEGERGISRSTWAWLALGSAALALSLWVFFRLQDTDASHEQALLNTEFDAYVNRARLAVDERAAASVLLFHPICGTGTNDTGQCGLILAVIRIPDLKTSLFPELDPTLGNLQVSDITDTRERIGIYPRFERHAPRLERVAGLHHFSDIIDVAGRRWEISVGLEAPPRSSEATVLLLLGCLISIWIFSTGLLQGRRTREVERRVGEALQRLRESETQYSQLLESVVEGIFGMDRNGNATFVNPAAARMLGYEINELIGKRMHSRIHHSHRDGSVVPVEIALAPINTAEGPQTLATVWDISERKRLDDLLRQRAQALETANRRLTQKNRELDEFAYIASHDLQAPLRGIVHLLEWVEEDLGDELGESVVHNMERMRGRVERMQLMIDDLLTYSRAGREEVQTEPVDTAEMISRVVQDLSLPAGFEVSCQESLPCFTTARTPLQTVFRNLIQNAVKHHDRDQGVVRIDCEGDGDWYTFTLSDDGPGIAAGQAERVFQIFQTLQPKDSHGGSGIGLAVSRRLVETGGGEIEVTAAGCDGRGCRFTFSWPVEWRAGGRLQR